MSVIVVFFDMKREAARTLFTLTTSYQQRIKDADFEVIALDNGSVRAPISAAFVQSFGSNFTHYRFSADVPSPVAALNFGARQATGRIIVIMVDGARMLSPRTLYYFSRAASLFDNPFVYTIGMHLGPQPQNISVEHGYNQQIEDQLLETVDWHRNGYSLFTISSVALSSGDGFFYSKISESNCFAMRRDTYLGMGGFDERFRESGGGLANLDFFNRALERPDIDPICLLGEASFHQFHGGIATNVPMRAHPWPRFAAEYEAIRGKPYATVTRAPHYLGHMPPECTGLFTRMKVD